MTRFWWVNHNQTARQEVEGQYLWSPKTESNGARSEFYNNMRRATPGDLVLSYYDQAVRHVGRVADFAFTAPKPAEFGKVGANWSQEGWLLPVFWTPVSPPVRPKAIISELAPLLPSKYSPLQQTSGDGNQKAYLAEVDHAVFELLAAHGTFDQFALSRGGANSLSFEIVNEILEDAVEQQIASDTLLDETERQAIIRARRGQGRFRSNVEKIEYACRLTGVTNPVLLIASHIKPWRVCETANERLDGMNGLLLTPDADLLFDRGFISFAETGEVLVSPRVDKSDLRRLGFDQLAIERFGFEEAPAVWKTESFAPGQQRYLGYHRAQVFVS
ncbi:HNH endonuclease [Phenylobacterium sp.]|uniref:HNH endonuclease n=1 Tax=Phenylobacterium sp. TaxID=1871053 RepID=UPI002FE18E28